MNIDKLKKMINFYRLEETAKKFVGEINKAEQSPNLGELHIEDHSQSIEASSEKRDNATFLILSLLVAILKELMKLNENK